MHGIQSLLLMGSLLLGPNARFVSSLRLSKRNANPEPIQRSKKHVIAPRNAAQQQYVNWLEDPKVPICLGVGPAGTGKTLFAGLAAVRSFERGDVDKIIVTRPLVSVNKEELGFLPGNLQKKMDPWVVPLFDTFLEEWSQKELDAMLRTGALEIAPLGFMRGRTFKRTFVLADEVQNASPDQLFMLLTRLGEDSKLVMTGDVRQSDYGRGNGLEDLLTRLTKQDVEGIRTTNFLNSDVERSQIVKTILALYEKS